MEIVLPDLECAVLLCKLYSKFFNLLTVQRVPYIIFIIYRLSSCGSSVTQNITYIQNPSYPTPYATTGTCVFSVTPLSSGINYYYQSQCYRQRPNIFATPIGQMGLKMG